ncbi:MAG: Ig-like domain-containing protein [Clostridiales bacterium]|nr:Ig-like domain-containing protein [Clostridiales bacterium]
MKMIDHLPKYAIRILMVLAMVAVVYQVIIPRTSVYFRYWLYQPKFGNYLNKRDIVLVSGEHFHLKVRNVNQRLKFSSTDYKVAFANDLGKVTAYRPGTAFIKVKVRDKVLICRVKVIKLNCSSVTLKVGESKKLNVLGNWFFESYTSSNEAVATVSKRGKVVAVSSGDAIITAKAKGKKIFCKVSVP